MPSAKFLNIFLLLIPFLTLSLNSCVGLKQGEKALSTGLSKKDIIPASAEERKSVERKDILIQAAFWAEELDKNPSDTESAIKLTTILRTLGKTENALNVADQALTIHPESKDLMISFALAAIELGKSTNALKALERLLLQDSTNKQGLLLSGICYDQLKEYEQSRLYYQKALQHYPEDPLTLTNIGYSYILSGNPEQAETYLRKAIMSPNARPETRQNLFLSLALQGKYQEARHWALKDLSEENVSKNIAYLKAMILEPGNRQATKTPLASFQTRSSKQGSIPPQTVSVPNVKDQPVNKSFKKHIPSQKKKEEPDLPLRRSF